MEGTITAKDKDGNVLLKAVFSDIMSRKALELFIRSLYGIQLYTTTITPEDQQEDTMVEPVDQTENDYWLPSVSGGDTNDTEILRKVI